MIALQSAIKLLEHFTSLAATVARFSAKTRTFPTTASASTRSTGDAAADQLRLLIERIEGLEEEKKGIGLDIKDVYLEAKATGYDTKIMREIIKLRAMNPHDRAERDAILETYRASLGID